MFGLVPSQPFVAGVSTLSAAVLNAYRANLANAVDGSAGGPYNLLAGHTLDFPSGGGNITIEAPFSATDIVLADVYGTAEWKSGSHLTTDSGSTSTFNGSAAFNGAAAFTGTSSVTGGTWGFYVATYVLDGATLHIGDTGLGVGHLLIDGRSLGAGSDITLMGNAEIHLETGAFLLTDSGSTSTFNGAVNLNGGVGANQTTLKGAIVQDNSSGAGFIAGRVVTVTGHDVTQTVDPALHDLVLLQSTLSNTTSTINLSAAPATDGVRCRFLCVRSISTGIYVITGVATLGPGSTGAGNNVFGQPCWVDVVSVGGSWIAAAYSNAGA